MCTANCEGFYGTPLAQILMCSATKICVYISSTHPYLLHWLSVQWKADIWTTTKARWKRKWNIHFHVFLPLVEMWDNIHASYFATVNDKTFHIQIWARLFKTNDVVSKRFVKISNINIWINPIFFVEKMWEAFALHCKSFSQFFNKKFQCIWLKRPKTL